MPLSATDKFIATLGIDPKPVREAYFEWMAPYQGACKTLNDGLYDMQQRMMGKEPIEVRIRDAFYRFDGDGNGHVDADELKLALGALGLNVNAEQAEAILAKYDDDGNETLELEEFATLVVEFEEITKVKVEDATLDSDPTKQSEREARASPRQCRQRRKGPH